MKKIVLIICFLASASMIFAQNDVSMSLSETLVTDVAENIEVGVTIDLMTPGAQIVGVQLSILYDPTYLSWNGTMAAPAPGVSYQNPGFTPVTPFGDYLWNTNFPGNLIMTWIDPTYVGFVNPDGDDLIRYWFHYNGGLLAGEESPITFSLTAQLKDGGYIKIVNELTDQNFTPMNFAGPCGGLCPGRIYYESVVTGKVWTGLGDGTTWFDGNNWSPVGAPTATDDVTINSSGKAPLVVINGGNAAVANLTVAAGAGIQIDPQAGLTTNGLYTNNGDLIIASDVTGYSGSFIDLGGLAGTGMFYMDRMVTCTGDPNPYDPQSPWGWHYVSAPIDGLSTDDLQDYYVNQWDETTGMFMNYAGSQVPPCTPFAGTETLDGMEVWSVKYDDLWSTYNCPQPVNGPVLMYSGAFTSLHTGPYAAPATYTAGAYAGWNMHPNPYPSGLDISQIVWPPEANPGVALYDCNNYGYFSPVIPPYVMPVGNGFFTEWNAAGTFSLSGAERAHDPDFYYKEDYSSLLTIEATGDETSDITHIRFMDNAQPGFAAEGDVHKLFASTEGLAQIYTTAGNDMLAINALPATDMVPMGFTSVTSGSYTLQAIETSEFSEVYLQDLVTGDVTDLLNASYTFDYTAGEDANRFIIHFAPVGIGENLMNGVSIWSTDNNIYVSVPKEVKGTISVYNMMGQEVVSTDTQPGTNVIPMENTNTYYVVKVLSSKNAVTGKVYIK